MNNILNIPEQKRNDRSDIETEARAWVISLDGDAPSEERLQEFRAWLKRSPAHKDTFENAAALWGDLDHWSVFLYPEEECVSDNEMHSTTSATGGGFRPVFATASLAVLVLSIGLVSYFYDPGLFQEQKSAVEYVSDIGEVKSIALPDGSDVRLNTQSKLTVSYANSARVIHLAEGEAFFAVSHDPDKPFVVYAGKFAVKAVGTAFSVRLLDGGVEVNVSDGRVEVSVMADKVVEKAIINLDRMENAVSVMPFVKGQRVILMEDQAELELVQKMEDENMEVELSWRNGLLIFDDDPLQDVVTEINRYTPIHIVIADAAIRDIRIGGYFRVDDVKAILNTIEKGFGLHVEQVDDELIYLMGQADQQPSSE
jgi:transmembrane sensor